MVVTRTQGSRRGTRSILKKAKNDRRRVNINRVMHKYNEGDKVAIVLDDCSNRKECLTEDSKEKLGEFRVLKEEHILFKLKMEI